MRVVAETTNIYIWNFDTRFVNFGFHSGVIYWRHNVGDSAWKMDLRRVENGTKERKQMHYASLPSTPRWISNFRRGFVEKPRAGWHRPLCFVQRALFPRDSRRISFFLSFFLFFLLFFFFFLLLSEPTGRDEQKCLSGTDFSRRKRDSNQRSLMDVGLCFRIPRHFSGLNFPPRFEMDDFYVTCSLHTKRPISHEIAWKKSEFKKRIYNY